MRLDNLISNSKKLANRSDMTVGELKFLLEKIPDDAIFEPVLLDDETKKETILAPVQVGLKITCYPGQVLKTPSFGKFVFVKDKRYE